MASSSSSSTSSYSAVTLTTFPLAPLTTTFIPPAACSGIYWSIGLKIVDKDSTCLPQGFETSATDYFSPGIACPSGYVTACSDTQGVSTITTVTCCPKRGDIVLSCQNSAQLTNVWSTLFCTWGAPKSGFVATITKSDSGTTDLLVSTMFAGDGMNAFGVRMVYESTDISGSTTSTPSSSISATTSSSSASFTPSMTTSTTVSVPTGDTGASTSNTISTGAIIGLSVALPLVALILATMAFFWWRRKKHRHEYEATSPGSPGKQGNPQDVVQLQDQGQKHEHDHRPLTELLADNGSVELTGGSGHAVAELPGEDWRE